MMATPSTDGLPFCHPPRRRRHFKKACSGPAGFLNTHSKAKEIERAETISLSPYSLRRVNDPFICVRLFPSHPNVRVWHQVFLFFSRKFPDLFKQLVWKMLFILRVGFLFKLS